MDTLTDADFDLADRLVTALEAAPADGLSPSKAGRAAKAATEDSRRVLEWMAAHQYCHTRGNGAWTRYRAGRRP